MARRLLRVYEAAGWGEDAAEWRAFLVPHTDGVWFDQSARITAVG